MCIGLANLVKKKGSIEIRNLLFLENYCGNADLSRFCKGIVELVEHHLMRNLMSNVIANYIQENKLFVVLVCDLFATYTRGVIEIICQFKVFVNTIVFA